MVFASRMYNEYLSLHIFSFTSSSQIPSKGLSSRKGDFSQWQHTVLRWESALTPSFYLTIHKMMANVYEKAYSVTFSDGKGVFMQWLTQSLYSVQALTLSGIHKEHSIKTHLPSDMEKECSAVTQELGKVKIVTLQCIKVVVI